LLPKIETVEPVGIPPTDKSAGTAHQASLFGEPEETPSPIVDTPKAPEPDAADKKTFRAGDTVEFD